ncbi:MAG: class I SAM-dependent methyltransferase [Thermoanaerobaculia bacterium]
MPADRSVDSDSATTQDLRRLYGEEYVSRFPDAPDRRLRRLAPLFELPRQARVLDLACGNGLLLDLLQGRVESYVGVDFSETFVAAARERSERLGLLGGRFVCSDIEAFLEAEGAPFDAAFALDFVEHVDDDDFRRIFRAVAHRLRPGAPLHLHTPNLAFLLERLKERGLLTQFPEHIAVREAGALVSLLEESGFRAIRVRHLAHYHPLLRPLHLLAGLGETFRARLFLVARS